jgi:uncharacterized repeat protein (TIGR01451 family)
MRKLALLALLLFGLAPGAARAFGATQCAGARFGSDLGCTANDVQITNMQALNSPPSCTGGGTITLDLLLTVNFGSASRYDVGIFLSNDGKDPQKTVASGGSASCSIAILPTTSPFLNLDSNGGTDLCGDGNSTIGGGTGSGQLTMTGVTVACQALNTTGQLYVPFVVSWDNQASPTGLLCRSIADPVPGTKSKCNAPVIGLTPQVIVLPTITKTDGKTQITPGDAATYTIAITNNTGVTLSTANGNAALFKDPAVTDLAVSSVTCAVTTGTATCPSAGSDGGRDAGRRHHGPVDGERQRRHLHGQRAAQQQSDRHAHQHRDRDVERPDRERLRRGHDRLPEPRQREVVDGALGSLQWHQQSQAHSGRGGALRRHSHQHRLRHGQREHAVHLRRDPDQHVALRH